MVAGKIAIKGHFFFFVFLLYFGARYVIMGIQKNKRRSFDAQALVVGQPKNGLFGDQETAVRIRGNSHYRISPLGVKSEC